MKRVISIILTFSIMLGLSSCSLLETEPQINEAPVISTGEYVLTGDNGQVSMFDSAGNVVSEVTLGGTSESEYIYTIDKGKIATASLYGVETAAMVMYAVDKSTRKLTILSVTDRSIDKKAEMILSDGNITGLYAYNGIFYYSTNSEDVKANAYSFERRQKLNEDGTLSYIQTVPMTNTQKSTYVYMENYFEEFLQASYLSKSLDASEIPLINIPKVKHAVYEIPTEVETWVANTNTIYFFSETQMGTYNTINDKITVYYGAINPVSAQYMNGIDKQTYLLSDFGENSRKTMLLAIDYKDMKVNRAIQIDYNNPMAMNIEKNKYIMLSFKVTNSEKTFSQLRVFTYEDYNELYVIGVNYLPTKILADNDVVYLFNPYEDNFLAGSIQSGAFSPISKEMPDGNLYTDIFLLNFDYSSDYYYDEYGRYVNKNNHLINEDGELVDENNDRVNILGQRIDALGRAIDKDGNLIDRYNNRVDLDGNIISYTRNTDGYFYNSEGQKCDIDGTVLVRNDDGDWVRPEEIDTEIIITGHYDEYGNFIIDKDILEAYPDAYAMWQAQRSEQITQ